MWNFICILNYSFWTWFYPIIGKKTTENTFTLEHGSYLAVIIGVIVALVTVYYARLSIIADHERRTKTVTLQEFNTFVKAVEKDRNLILKMFKNDVIKVEKIIDISGNVQPNMEKVYSSIKRYLSHLEFLSTGVNTGIYDFETINRLYSGALRFSYKQLSEIIKFRRYNLNQNTAYCEFQKLVNALENNPLKNSKSIDLTGGNIKFSKF